MTLSVEKSIFGFGEREDVVSASEQQPTARYDRAGELGGSAVVLTIQERELGYPGDDIREGDSRIILGND